MGKQTLGEMMKEIEKRLDRLEKLAASREKLDAEIQHLLSTLGIQQFTPSATGMVIVYDPQLTSGEAAIATLQPFLPDPGAVRCTPCSDE